MIKTFYKTFTLVTLGILTANCLSFRSGEFEGAPVVKKFGVPKKISVKVNANYQVLVDGQPGSTNEFLVQKWKNEPAKLLNESDDVSATRSETEANYIFDIKVTEEMGFFSANVSIWFFLPTLGILPYYTGSHITMTLAVKDKKGKVLGEIKREENKTEIGQLLLILVMPFADPVAKVDAQRRELLSSAYSEIKEKGYLK
ncbi:hypothetical protein [Leptospira vanthielii]|uniref:Lipoprotein n=1 Tax=Leptospira vanthielii serovar Holland str. Waz Holland = ATCC 700522 TaxID=1218591 RepID=N1W3U5_9LEPT|nr:hypothetical protein [Leptospira vanthielii]EMY68125.1 hypothetical protein LEP1GSC199_0817 [Leptospira vanthielii serovar Holland str. Waz Holland = ATCC 700522]